MRKKFHLFLLLGLFYFIPSSFAVETDLYRLSLDIQKLSIELHNFDDYLCLLEIKPINQYLTQVSALQSYFSSNFMQQFLSFNIDDTVFSNILVFTKNMIFLNLAASISKNSQNLEQNTINLINLDFNNLALKDIITLQNSYKEVIKTLNQIFANQCITYYSIQNFKRYKPVTTYYYY